VNDDSVPEADVLSRFDRQAAVLRLVVEEVAHAERIDRVQSVPARMPVRRMPWIAGMIHHHDAHVLAVDLP
jgi:hypothetical protein